MIRWLAASVLIALSAAVASAAEPVPLHGQRATLFDILVPDSTSIVFLGNSLTHGCEWHELLGMPNVLNRGINGDTTEDIAGRAASVIAGKPAKIFLLTGANDVSHNLTADSIAGDVLKLVDRILMETPSTKLYLQSLLPVNNSFGRYKLMFGKEQTIRDINKLLEKGAAERGIPFIDIHTLMCDADGNLRADLTNDGLHLLGPGYLIWKEALLPYLDD